MKNSILTLVISLLIVLLLNSSSFAQQQTVVNNKVKVTVENLVKESGNSITFDIYATNNGTSAWIYSNGQYALNFNNSILGNGSPIATMISGTTTANPAPSAVSINGNSPNRYYKIQTANQSISGTVLNPTDSIKIGKFRLSTTSASFDGSQVPFIAWYTSNIKVYYWDGSQGVQLSSSNVTSYNYLPNNPLPVELASFTSNVNGRDVKLTWKTTKEINNSGFDIERKSLGGSWSKVAFVTGKGTTNNISTYNFEDNKLSAGKYSYRLKQVDYNGNYEYFSLNSDINVNTPSKFELSQNYPNPFNPTTKIDYNIPVDSKVTINVFDNAGRQVASLANGQQQAGFYSIQWNASNLSSGMYFCQLTATSETQNIVITKKMTLIK